MRQSSLPDLPILYDHALIGRIDPKTHRKEVFSRSRRCTANRVWRSTMPWSRRSRRLLAEIKVAVKSFSCQTGYTEKRLNTMGLGSAARMRHVPCVIRAVSFNESDKGDCHLCVKTLRVSFANTHQAGRGNSANHYHSQPGKPLGSQRHCQSQHHAWRHTPLRVYCTKTH